MSADPSPGPLRVGKLVGLLALFLVPGAACAAYLWHVLSEVLAGRLPETGVLLTSGALLLVLVAILRGLGYSLRRYGPGSA